ncbi:hypothetical protein EYZ11_008445 [Aspergillus tanneri]|uniref:Uncharacterized protein n=1 Tax=Aspergillus tanneri TaxID=1220188 RepID=A0A4S3JAT2_9EURO|nr:hypothetical protein EYZ11_008445 [Aspergillus tanneri]
MPLGTGRGRRGGLPQPLNFIDSKKRYNLAELVLSNSSFIIPIIKNKASIQALISAYFSPVILHGQA